MKTYRPILRTKALVCLLVIAGVGCTMQNKPKPVEEPAVVEDTVMSAEVPADTASAAISAHVYPSDEDKDLWVLVDSFRRTIPNRIDYATHQEFRDDSLSESTYEALTATDDSLTKRTFALFTTSTLFGSDGIATEQIGSDFFGMLTRNPELISRIKCLLTEVPEEYRNKLIEGMAVALVFESVCYLPHKSDKHAAKNIYRETYDFIAANWPQFIDICKENGIVFEPHEDYIQINDLEYSLI